MKKNPPTLKLNPLNDESKCRIVAGINSSLRRGRLCPIGDKSSLKKGFPLTGPIFALTTEVFG